INDAYWWARAAIEHDASYLVSYNTLAVVYQRAGHFNHAVLALSRALEREPSNTQALTNLARVYGETGRSSESAAIGARLAKLEPHPPFSYYYQGMAALRAGDAVAARDLFAKEVDRAGYYHEFHFWLAIAYLQLGQTEPARAHMTIAHERSTTRDDQQLYANKLQLLKSSALQPVPSRP
ncbi:MAG: tetratricopeptide repeat protein, partial [Burkholderiaceae bacterium]